MAISYKDAGVDVQEGNRLVNLISSAAKSTHIPGVLGSLGGFCGMFEMPGGYENPVLVAGTDGVGTKLKLAIASNRHSSVGIDLVAMVVNDMIVVGAKPLFFLDYYACSELSADGAAEVVRGIAKGCTQAGCALLGGETAEMPGMYQAGDYDIAGFGVGIVDKSEIRDGSALQAGDVLIGLPSAGLHSNGFSLVRALLERHNINFDDKVPNVGTVIDELLRPTQIYVDALAALSGDQFIAACHITGGGLIENPPRMLQDDTLAVELIPGSWKLPPVFTWLASLGVDPAEMVRTFNCGIGMVIAARQSAKEQALSALAPWQPSVVGNVVPRTSEPVVFTEPCDSLF